MSKSIRFQPSCLTAIVLFVLVWCLPGCGDGTIRSRLTGRVMLDDRPLAEARVLLHPRAVANATTAKPHAVSDAQGNFTVTIVSTGDGPAYGDYDATVELRAPRTVGEDTVRDGRNLLPAKYAKPETSGLRVEFRAGTIEIPEWKLKSQ